MEAKQPSAGARDLIDQVIRYMPGGILPAVITVLSAGVFTRLLSTAEYGNYSLIMGFSGFATALACRWLEQSVSRYLPEAQGEQQAVALKDALVVGAGTANVAILVAGVCLVGVLLLKGGAVWIPLLGPAILLTVFTAMFQQAMGILQAEMKAGRYSTYQLVITAVRFIFCLVCVMYVTRGAAGLLWGSAFGVAVVLPFLWKDAGLRIPHRLSAQLVTVRRLAAYGMPMVGWFLAATLLNISDRWVIQWFRGASEVGIYSANYGLIAGGAGLIGAPVLLAAHPFLMRAWGDGDRERTARWLGIITEWFLLSAIVLIACSMLFARDVAHWFLGPAFRGGYGVMAPVLAGTLAWQLGMYAHKPLEFYGKTRLMLGLGIAAALLNIVLNLLFVPWLGYVAAAYTTLASYLLYVVAAAHYGRQLLSWQIRWRPLLKNGVFIGTIGFTLAAYARGVVEANVGYVAGLVTAGTLSMITTALMLISHGVPLAILRRQGFSK